MPKPQQIKREMSNACGSFFPLLSLSNSDSLAGDHSIPSKSSTTNHFSATASSPSTSSLTGQIFSYSNAAHPTYAVSPSKKDANVQKRTLEEQEIIRNTKARFASRLAADHSTVLSPNVDTPFLDVEDVISRLLPYHVFQQPKEDLELLTNTRKGKGRATIEDLKAEISETAFALECHRRKAVLADRFRKVKIRSGKRSAPDDQVLMIAQAVLDSDRAETTSLSNELRTLRAELERIEREKRAAANSTRMVYYPPRPNATATAQPQYYRGYQYAYTQAYGAPSQSSSTPNLTASPTTPSTPYTPYVPNGAIPVQLPVASLPALHALGIIPIPFQSLQEGSPQPPAVLRGSTSNGTMLSLEINVSLLQPVQMSGLATVLNSLMARSSSTTLAGSTSDPAPPPVPNSTDMTING